MGEDYSRLSFIADSPPRRPKFQAKKARRAYAVEAIIAILRHNKNRIVEEDKGLFKTYGTGWILR